ncbi:imidazoleglycerol-phosphate dehydratase [Candidatus Vidania fulgoroideae]|uniref:Imidazoleglycerol-phosphate dehydratase n=1 Tax=Candidatus Vidania fulgoroideorum TaxID=881286 RepID=A0A974X6W6_9PROT|nr:imidazoleglycerol-phosphate dehydratase [Candidatus Vidania fulgoroideae]
MKKDFYLERKTLESNIKIRINTSHHTHFIKINSGIKAFDHMLYQTAYHGNISIKVNCIGDLMVDTHHTIEDTGIVIGKLLKKIFHYKKTRFTSAYVAMDEALTRIVVDISGRSFFNYNLKDSNSDINGISINKTIEFLKALVRQAQITLHLSNYGSNNHHIIESIFKCLGIIIKKSLKLKRKFNYSTKYD